MPLKTCTRLLPAILCLWAVTTGAEEQLEQDTIVIKGNPGLPDTLFIAPWKRVGAPLQSGSLEGEIGEESEPLERDLFQRELELQREGYSVEKSPPPRTSPAATVDSGTTR